MATLESEIQQPSGLNLHLGLSPKKSPIKDQSITRAESPISSPDQVLNVRIESSSSKDATMASKGSPKALLERAALEGKWEEALVLLKKDSSLETDIIAPGSMTALHVAAFKGHLEFVKNMVNLLPEKALEKRDDRLGTALNYVAFTGSLETARALIKKSSNLLDDPYLDDEVGDQDEDNKKRKRLGPLYYAVKGSGFGNSTSMDLVRYLVSETKNEKVLTEDLVMILVAKGYLDILLDLLKSFPMYLNNTSNAADLLSRLAVTPSNFYCGSSFGFWQKCIYSIIPVQDSHKPRPRSDSRNNKDPHEGYQRYLRKICPMPIQHVYNKATSCIKHLHDAKRRHHCALELVNVVCRQILNTDAVKECFTKQPQILNKAIESGNIDVLRICFKLFPQLIWIRLWNVGNFLQAAIRYRHGEIFKFLMEEKTCFTIECYNDFDSDHNDFEIDDQNNSDTDHNDFDSDFTSDHSNFDSGHLLHKVAKLPFQELSSISGPALQMQSEMQWFKAVEKLVPPNLLNEKNNDNLTALELFNKEHKNLAEAGEKWMKDTSNSCMIVSTLITTVVFAAAFTVPGGNNNDDGLPVFLWNNAFLVFAISNVLALFSSLTSLLMLLSILTARYAIEDFLKALPKRLIIGLASLFLAIATMIIAFGAALSIVLGKRLEWVSKPISIVFFACVPVSIFGLLELPLFIQMVKSTYWPIVN